MTSSRADQLLASPLGRELLAVYVGWGPGESFGEGLSAQLGLGPVPGRLSLSRMAEGPRRWQDEPPDVVSRVIGYAVSWRSWREVLASIGEGDLLAEVAGLAQHFGFSGEDERVWGLTAMAMQELLPVAEALVASPGARGWWDPADLADQRYVEWDGLPRLTGLEAKRAVRECMTAERADNAEGLLSPRSPERPDVTIGAWWWSAPGFAPQAWTTPAVGGLPAAGLCEFFDAFLPPGDADGADVWHVQIDPQARVLEVTCPADWQDLVTRFPRDVSCSPVRRSRWWPGRRTRCTGRHPRCSTTPSGGSSPRSRSAEKTRTCSSMDHPAEAGVTLTASSAAHFSIPCCPDSPRSAKACAHERE